MLSQNSVPYFECVVESFQKLSLGFRKSRKVEHRRSFKLLEALQKQGHKHDTVFWRIRVSLVCPPFHISNGIRKKLKAFIRSKHIENAIRCFGITQQLKAPVMLKYRVALCV